MAVQIITNLSDRDFTLPSGTPLEVGDIVVEDTAKYARQDVFRGWVRTGAISVVDVAPGPTPLYWRPPLNGLVELIRDLGNVSGTKSIGDISAGQIVKATITGPTTFTFPTVPSGVSVSFALHLTSPGAGAIAWPASVDWGDDGAPDFTDVEYALVTFTTVLAGSPWLGALAFMRSAA